MRSRERRAATAVTDALAHSGPIPDLRELARAVGEAVGADGCALLIGGRRFQWGDGSPWLSNEVVHGGELVAELLVTPESVGSLPSLAAVLGPPVAAMRLAEEVDRLRLDGDTSARTLADDRWRAAAEMEQERRGLERDLHDGAQHHLVALRMSLALAEFTKSEGSADLLNQLDTTERVLINTAAGILPGALVAGGLGAALRTQLARYDNVTLDLASLRRRYPPPVESAVYFVVLEAVNNARKHAPGARVVAAVRDGYRGLELTVADNGPGFDMAAVGVPGLVARAATVGGSVTIRSRPGAGTTIDGIVPI